MTDGPFGSNLKSSDYIPSGVRVIRLGNIGVGEFKDDDRSFVSEEKFASLTKHEACAGDLVIAALAEPVGRACIVPDTIGPALVKADCVRARITPEVGAMLVMRWMNSPEGLRSAALASHGIGRLRINLGEMRALPVPLPPAPEQRRIVAKLDAVFAQTRAAKARLERLPALIEKLRQALVSAALRGELSGHNSPGLPPGWTLRRFDNLALFVTSGSRGWGEYYSATGPLFIRSQDINTDRLRLEDAAHVTPPQLAEGSRTRVERNDLLITITGANVTRAAYVEEDIAEAYVSQHVALIRLSPEAKPLAPFLHLFLVAEGAGRGVLRKAAYGGGKPGLNLAQLRSLVVPIPPSDEAADIVQKARVFLGALDQLRERVARHDAQLNRLELAATAKAFRGELVAQDPADEPAEVLLERIRAAKAEEAPVVRRPRAAAATTYAAPPVTLAQAAESGPLFKHALDRQTRAAAEPAALDLVVAALQQSDGRLTAAAIAQATGLDPAAIRAPLKELVAAGQVRTHGKARGTTYEWTQ